MKNLCSKKDVGQQKNAILSITTLLAVSIYCLLIQTFQSSPCQKPERHYDTLYIKHSNDENKLDLNHFKIVDAFLIKFTIV